MTTGHLGRGSSGDKGQSDVVIVHARAPSKCVTINIIHETMIHCIMYIKNRERVIFMKYFLEISVIVLVAISTFSPWLSVT